jgi:hypothetical protein
MEVPFGTDRVFNLLSSSCCPGDSLPLSPISALQYLADAHKGCL